MTRLLRLFALVLLAAGAGLPAAAAEPAVRDEVTLAIFNRNIVTFRSDFLGIAPAARAARAKATITDALKRGGDHTVTVKENPEGQLVLMGDTLAFVVTAGDADPLSGETPAVAAARAARNLEQVIAETREARNLEAMLKGTAWSAVATIVFVVLVWGIRRIRTWVSRVLLDFTERKVAALRVGGAQVVETGYLIPVLRRVFIAFAWVVIALLAYEWLSFVLSRFPYTRPWGERLNDYFVNVVEQVGGSIVGAIPGLGVAIVIFLIARFSVGFLGRFLERLSRAEAPPEWLGPDTMPTTRRLISIGIWLFALAMAYPYLPGAETEAFKGLSVLVGLMISLGASSVVGQAASGLILTYTRTLHVGEYVRIGDNEGTVTRLGAFTTTIRTGLGEELTLPNSLITGSVTRNYSRTVRGPGYIVDTTVTIGYDTPWRQVEAMLKEAARRTPGILADPSPRVFQIALSDFYPEYRLVAQAVPSQPLPRAEVMATLHANIQDVFNEYNVQIMSPHYLGDPAHAKVVKREDWHLPPAQPD
ncbi:MAG: mechanosensitive ion channel [Betaproteobacteria bacterium]|nr:mechanosensitive ion channel [Betaproteobacteria bacterium]